MVADECSADWVRTRAVQYPSAAEQSVEGDAGPDMRSDNGDAAGYSLSQFDRERAKLAADRRDVPTLSQRPSSRRRSPAGS